VDFKLKLVKNKKIKSSLLPLFV